jgi:homoserine kinase
MGWLEHPVVVRAPATSANLGPGFDALGLALALYDQVEARVARRGLSVEVSGEGADTARLGERHLVVRAMRAAFARLGGQPPGLALRCVNTIPHGRGLGSSAAAIVSGVLAAQALAGESASPLSGPDVLRLATELEGHPDNVAACLAGGFTISWRPAGTTGPGEAGGQAGTTGLSEAGRQAGTVQAGTVPAGTVPAGTVQAGTVQAGTVPAGTVPAGTDPAGAGRPGHGAGRDVSLLKLTVHRSVRAVVFVPPFRSATREARRVLPATVPHPDAAATAGRCGLLVAALTIDPSVLFDATEDFLHQPYRAPMMPQTAALLARLRGAGIAAAVSGAGPAVLALLAGPEPAAGVDSIAAEAGIGWHVIPLDIDRHGATVSTRGMGVPRRSRAGERRNPPGVRTRLPRGRPRGQECQRREWC